MENLVFQMKYVSMSVLYTVKMCIMCTADSFIHHLVQKLITLAHNM